MNTRNLISNRFLARLFAVLFLFSPLFANAVIEGHKYPFDNQSDAERFQHLSENLRCPKCQNQNLADSNAPVAIDMRDKVYDLMQQGKTDEDIVNYLVARYGDFVTYKPPFKISTLLLWLGPLLMFLMGFFFIVMMRKNQQNNEAPQPLSDEEKARLAALKNAYTDMSGKEKI